MLVERNCDQAGEWGISDKGEARLRRFKVRGLGTILGLLVSLAGVFAGALGVDPGTVVGVGAYLLFAVIVNVFWYRHLWAFVGRKRALWALRRERSGLGPDAMRP